MEQSLCAISSNMEISPGVHLIWVEAPHIAAEAQPGQFVTLRCEGLVLRRPFSVHQVAIASEANGAPENSANSWGKNQSQIALLFQVIGKGTLWLSQRQRGDKIDILGPLGKGFSIEPTSKNLLLIAGGLGIAPLVFLAQRAVSQHSIILIHGARTAVQLYKQSLPPEVQFIPVTEDGSGGKKGMATDILPDFLDWADQVYACGPIDMYKTIVARGLVPRCQVSLEVRMGCGIGACYGCTIKTKNGLKQVCRDGPVFELNGILWEEVKL